MTMAAQLLLLPPPPPLFLLSSLSFGLLLLLATTTTTARSTCVKNTLKIPDNVKHRSKTAVIIGHRGASYHLPEHTLPSYRLALELGADYVEPDVVATSDQQLIALHTVDLEVTTDVADVFPPSSSSADDRRWFSPRQNRSGYWTFNFTLDEIRELTVRQRVTPHRSAAHDGLFGVPTLREIVDVLHRWNSVDLPALSKTLEAEAESMDAATRSGSNPKRPTPLQLQQSGLYLELKDGEWLLEEAGIDLTKLVYDEMKRAAADVVATTNQGHDATTSSPWSTLFRCFEEVRFDEYVVPGVVVQSFEADALERFHSLWTADVEQVWSSGGGVSAEPPYVLLTKHPDCWQREGGEGSFWFEVGERYRAFLGGIGPEKTCLLDPVEGPAFLQRSREFDLVLHPWTERPEASTLSSSSLNFDTTRQETRHLLCRTQGAVRGIFSESVNEAVLVAATGCDGDDDDDKKEEDNSSSDDDGDDAQKKNDTATTTTPASGFETRDDASLCYHSEREANLYVGLASFCMGAFVTAVLGCCCAGTAAKRHSRTARLRRRGVGATQVPTVDEELDGDMEML
jgi:glycerophosphoryl diester phosphodiesterase